jgi:hypothetical protein
MDKPDTVGDSYKLRGKCKTTFYSLNVSLWACYDFSEKSISLIRSNISHILLSKLIIKYVMLLQTDIEWELEW